MMKFMLISNAKMQYEDLRGEAQNAIDRLESFYKDKIIVDQRLKRSIVSFQANKSEPFYRWFKYKEGFSKELVQMYLSEISLPRATVLDPFSGTGTTLSASAELGFFSEGIELLPMGQIVSKLRTELCDVKHRELGCELAKVVATKPWRSAPPSHLNELAITSGAYPDDTRRHIEGFLSFVNDQTGPLKSLLTLSLIAILESVSYTRKDGQYLRWDSRSKRIKMKGSFDKGKILSFEEAISAKLELIGCDLLTYEFFSSSKSAMSKTISGSCLDVLPKLPSEYFGATITSPPYCNRYDYTRTYALELAALGIDEIGIRKLRQEMLSCTVENKQKDLLSKNPSWDYILSEVDNHFALNAIVRSLQNDADHGDLNNPQIVRMVRGYFQEMACVIWEIGRLSMSSGTVIMVNDNVRFGGLAIPVDCILSDFAKLSGFHVKQISALPRGKGNSSQQMGKYGRLEVRKCVYIWEKV